MAGVVAAEDLAVELGPGGVAFGDGGVVAWGEGVGCGADADDGFTGFAEGADHVELFLG